MFFFQTKAYDLNNKENTHLPFTLIDTKGIEHGSEMNTDEIFSMLQGHVEVGEHLNSKNIFFIIMLLNVEFWLDIFKPNTIGCDKKIKDIKLSKCKCCSYSDVVHFGFIFT